MELCLYIQCVFINYFVIDKQNYKNEKYYGKVSDGQEGVGTSSFKGLLRQKFFIRYETTTAITFLLLCLILYDLFSFMNITKKMAGLRKFSC